MLKTIHIDEIGEIIFARRRGTRSIRLSVSGGRIRLGAPYNVSERQAVAFALERRDWILRHLKPVSVLQNDSRIGKAHRIQFVTGTASRPTTKLEGTSIVVRLPREIDESSQAAQTAAKRIAKKALLKEAETLLPQRLASLAEQMGIGYKSLRIKFINSRWGSCDNHNNIVLNGYLIQLPWPIIDYVITHELAHTREHNHSPAFWAEVARMIPDHKERRKILKTYHTDVLSADGLAG